MAADGAALGIPAVPGTGPGVPAAPRGAQPAAAPGFAATMKEMTQAREAFKSVLQDLIGGRELALGQMPKTGSWGKVRAMKAKLEEFAPEFLARVNFDDREQSAGIT
eukprot:2727955-Pyramimonas_sp.AAC.1